MVPNAGAVPSPAVATFCLALALEGCVVRGLIVLFAGLLSWCACRKSHSVPGRKVLTARLHRLYDLPERKIRSFTRDSRMYAIQRPEGSKRGEQIQAAHEVGKGS